MKKILLGILAMVMVIGYVVGGFDAPIAWTASGYRIALTGGARQFAKFIDDDSMATGTSLTISSSESIRAYVDAYASGNTVGTIDAAGGVWNGTNYIKWEGATANTYEGSFSFGDPTADFDIAIPHQADATNALILSRLATNAYDVANSLWGSTNYLYFEGATANAHETALTVTDPTADVIYEFPTGTAGTYYPVISTLAANQVDVANSVWMGTSQIIAEGSVADAYETTISFANPGADQTLTVPATGANGAFLTTTLTTNNVGANNSIYGVSNGLAFEGATGDGTNILTLTVADPSAARTITLPNASGYPILGSAANGTVNAVYGAANAIVWEGATTADTNDTSLKAVDPTGGNVVWIPNAAGTATSLMVSTLVTNTYDAANSIWAETGSVLKFEGSSADAHETSITVTNPTADVVYEFPTGAAGTYYPVVSTLATNFPEVADSVWFEANNVIVFEGLTVDAHETRIQALGATADVIYTLADMPAASYALMFSTLTTNALDVANSVWMESNAIAFEGSSADEHEIKLTADNATADVLFKFVNQAAATYAVVFSTLVTNALDVANSIWLGTSQIIFEGSTADAHETALGLVNPTADRTITLPDASGGAQIFTDYTITTVATGATTTAMVGDSITIPEMSWLVGTMVSVECGGTLSGDAAKTAYLVLDGGTLLTMASAAADAGDYVMTATVLPGNTADTQRGAGKLYIDGALAQSAADYATGAVNVTGDVVIEVKFAAGDADGDLITNHYCTWVVARKP